MSRDIRQPIISVEGAHPISHGDRVIMGKLSHWEEPNPVVLLMSNECPEIGFNHLIEPFHLSVSLQVKG